MVEIRAASALAACLAATMAWACASSGSTLDPHADGVDSAAVATSERAATAAASGDWPSYNRTLLSERFVELAAIDRQNVGRLQPVCTYDLGIDTSFQTGPIVVGPTLYATTEKETFAIDAATCAERWRVAETVADSYLKVNRGVAHLDGRLFRGLQDGRVVAYDAATGRKLWETRIADSTKGESVPASPLAWGGLVFIGQAGGDNKGVKGRMYALDAASGKQVWETYLVPREEDRDRPGTTMAAMAAKTWRNPPNIPITGGATWTSYTLDPDEGLLYVPGGNPAPDFVDSLRPGDNLFANSIVVLDAKTGAYRRHFSLVPEDFHDWDVSAAPTVVTTRSGRRLLAAAPKDGLLYGIDLASGERLYTTAITTRENVDTPLTPQGTRFCPGSQGGSEWNGPAYAPPTNLLYTGTVDWCTTVQVADPEKVASVPAGQPWSGSADEANAFGKMDPKEKWGGWVTATDADSGEVRWRYRTPAPVLAAVTPTAGGLVFAADMNGNAYAFDAENGNILWRAQLDGAAGGGVVSYEAGGAQRIAFVAGTNSPIWPVEKKTAKVVVFAVP
jgi:alcohol dehydrogenase (cytochrome c)